MKKIYFLASMLLLGSGVSAQVQTQPVMRADAQNIDAYNNERPVITGQDRAPGDVIGTYQDDFSNPANWTVANNSNPSGDWQINSTGPGVGAAFASTTAANGFAWYDADAIGVDLSSTTDAQLTYNTVMDFSANPAVAVSFESYYQEYQTSVYVEVSTNGLAGPWTQYEVHTDITDNNASANPTLVNVNVSAQAGGQSNVAVRFNYQGGWGWFWSIDDFKMIEAYEHELETTWAHFSSGTETNEYYAIPTTQITEITFGSLVTSNGVTTQTNVQMTADVNAGSEYSGVSGQVVTLNEAQSDSFSIETPNGWTPSGAGAYDLVVSVGSDQGEQLPGNNDWAPESITVGGNIYSRDDGIITGGFSGFISTQGDPIAVGNTFEIFGDMSFGHIDIGLTSAAASEGELIYGAVYKWNGVDNFDWVVQTEDYSVQNGDLGSIVSLELPFNVDVFAGELYLIVAGRYTDNASFAQAQPTQEQTVLAVHTSGLLAGADPSAIICRINTTPSTVGIEDPINVTGLNIYPNPADQSTLLSYNVVNEANVALTLTDLSGKVVYTENYGTQAAGQYNVDLSTAELSNGVYFYSLTVGESTVTKKFVVSH
ncbi:MAG: T9SS type A sorting domain-containing protein [Crocinitomicaceae bacterium]|nr:T9SS type A sorting domain-containing protein [Crocinitomicaceae bacterium]